MSSTQFHIPGAYYFDAPPSSAPAPLTANIFRPPISPSASTSVLNSIYSETSTAKTNPPPRPPLRRPSGKKRTRDDITRESSPLTEWSHMGRAETPLDNGGKQIRYILAGQIETPGSGAVTNPMEAGLQDSVYSDVDYRRTMGSKKGYEEVDSPSDRRSSLGVGSVRDAKVGQITQSWTVLGTIGGVVGKVLDFCRGGAFKGFYAGGGRSFEMDAAGSVTANDWGRSSPGQNPIRDQGEVPGHFRDNAPPERTPVHEHYSSTPESTPRPAAKRRQVSEVGDELRKNWVMVEEREQRRARSSMPATTTTSRPSSRKEPHVHQPANLRPTTTRRISTPVSRLSSNQYSSRRSGNAPRVSHAGSPSLVQREPASFAAPRSPSRASPAPSSRIPIPTKSTNPFVHAASPRPNSRASGVTSPKPPVSGHRRSGSNASAASTTSRRKIGVGEIKASPRLDAEAKHLAMGKLARERDAEERMDAFSVRLRDMIRQGKEALGTRVEVGDERDDAWSDDA